MSEIYEKIGTMDAKVTAAHHRLDKLELAIRDDLKELKVDLKELNAYMHKGKGWSAAVLFLAGLSGAGLTKLIATIFATSTK
jgi:hypothetical protein